MDNASLLNQALSDVSLNRRGFLKLSAALGGMIALAGSGLKFGLETLGANAAGPVKIVPTGCSHNCGGRCVLRAHVQDGTIVRISTDVEPNETLDLPEIRACVRGRAYRKFVYHPDRLKYPMKRVGKRGEGNFKRITWEEAFDGIAKEMTRLKQAYGPESFYVHYGWGTSSAIQSMVCAQRLFNMFGGRVNFYNSYSTAATSTSTPYTYGTGSTGHSRDDWLNSKLMILWGWNPAETIFGTNTTWFLRKCHEKGVKIIVIDPRLTDTAVPLADQWIANYPGTDNALMDAMAYVMISENLHDQAFLDKYCLGFDEDHMPAGAPKNASYKAYVMGDADKQPKTPEWAEPITGVPANTIRQLAREYATTKPAIIRLGWGSQRAAYGEQPPRGSACLAAMTGNVGISGGEGGGQGSYGRSPRRGTLPTGDNPIKASIPVFLWTDAVTRGKEMTAKDGVTGVDRLPANLKLLWGAGSAVVLHNHGDLNRTAQILSDEKLLELIVITDVFMTPAAKFADYLLPSTSYMEREDVTSPWGFGDYLVYMNQAIEPMYECKNDYDICAELAKRLGFGDKYTEGRSQADWVKFIVETTTDVPNYAEFKAKGIHKFTFKEPFVAFKAFRENPTANKLTTPSGKIEIYSERLAARNDPEVPPIGKYIPPWEGRTDPLVKKYPLQLISPHIKSRIHSVLDNVEWLNQELVQQRVWINTLDAAERGIKDGDTVRVQNDRGVAEIPCWVTNRIMPGVACLPHGGWFAPDSKGVDRRGCPNTFTSLRPTPWAKGNAQHSMLVQITKV